MEVSSGCARGPKGEYSDAHPDNLQHHRCAGNASKLKKPTIRLHYSKPKALRPLVEIICGVH